MMHGQRNDKTFRRIKYESIKGNTTPYTKNTPALDVLQDYRFNE
jgi:hypothetical protein